MHAYENVIKVCYGDLQDALKWREPNFYTAGEVIPVEMCYLGWQESLAQLAHLVEPDIAG